MALILDLLMESVPTPRELIAVAHLSCFGMKLPSDLQEASFMAECIEASSEVIL